MKTLIWILRFVVFIALFGLAIKNSATVDLRFYFDRHIDAPLSLVVLGTFVLGVGVGISAAISTLLRQRRELGRMRRRDGDVREGS
jgi:putative membrane protein